MLSVMYTKQPPYFFFLILIFCSIILPCHGIRPTQPILVNPNTQSSPSNFIFYFKLQKKLPTTGYLMVTLPTFTTSAIPINCIVLNNLNLTATKCVNLNTAGDAITITQSGVNSVNTNINAAQTVVIQFNSQLNSSTEYQIQIMTTNVLPNIDSITKSFQLYTITGTGVMIEQNWNFGQVYLEPKQNLALSVLSRNSMVSNLPGTTFNSLLFQITIGVATPTPNSRFKFVISGGFTFDDSSLVNTQGLIGPAPVIISNVLVSPNVIVTTFNQSFTVGRKFTLTIASFNNPLSISSGYISVYHLPFNSLSPLQISQQSIPIQTIPYVPILTLLTIDGTTPQKPIQFYTSTTQYIRLTIRVPRDVNANFQIKIESDTLLIHEGSVYAITSTVDTPLVNYNYYSTKGVMISGFPIIPQNSLITVTMRVDIPANPIFTITVSIDQFANLGNPIIFNSVVSNSAAIPQTYISNLYGSQNQQNKISWMQTTDSSIYFTVTPTFLTNAGSSLKIITSKNLIAANNFIISGSCTVAGNIQLCTITTNLTFTTISIASNSSYNLFPQGIATAVTINNINFNFASSHTNYIYHLYFSLTVSQAVGAADKNLLRVPIVIPQRNQLTGFANYFSNRLNNSGTNYPNVIRLVNQNPSQWNNVIQVFQRRIISIFAYQKWTNLFSLQHGDSYPAASNIDNFTFTYHTGTTNSLNLNYPIDWDRVDIILDGSQSSSTFSIVLPTTYTLSLAAYNYEIMVGVYNTITRQIRYLFIQPQPIAANPTYIAPSATSLSALPLVNTNGLQLAGFSGSYKDNINITITPGGSYSATNFAAALIVVSDWNWFDSQSGFNSLSLAATNPQFNNTHQIPKSIYMPKNQKYLTYIPIKTSSAVTNQFLIYMDGIKIPYTNDLPYYSIYLVDDTGVINCYNQFINQQKSVFYSSYLKSVTFTCNVNSLGVINTYCTLTFIPNHDIQINSVFTVQFIGMQISTNTCTMTQLPTTSIPSTCISNTDKNQLTISMQNTQRLPADSVYSILMSGVTILQNTIVHYIVGNLMDPTASYVIETGTRILLTSVQQFNPVYITQVKYSKNNPIVSSFISIKFNLPRPLNDDEMFSIVMSKDLSNLNTISSKLNVVLYDSNNTIIPVVWYLNLKNYQILFQNLNPILTASSYTIMIYGINTPSTISQDLISIIYLRRFDATYTLYNNDQSTTLFPKLSDKINSLVRMSPYFNTEGLQQQLVFTVTNQYAPVTQHTVWVINLPQYYSEYLWNQDYLVYCTISGVKINCFRDPNTPYQFVVNNSPRIIQVGNSYVLSIYGLQCPRAAYLNGNAAYVTQGIFFGVSENSSSPLYIDYSDLFLTQSLIDTQTQTDYGSIVVVGISSSNMQVRQATFFIINATCTQPITAGQFLYITFPEQFDNFHDLSLTVQIVQGANVRTYTAEVVNRRIGVNMIGMSLLSNTIFSIKISSLPTPSVALTVDMNKLRIIAATADRLGTTAASIQLHNLVSSITFIPSSLHIVINNYAQIQVTAGTYSMPILIQPSDFGTFVSNMEISFVSSALAFGESSKIYLGDQSGKLTVGADSSIIPTIYAFDIIKTQASISAFYTSLNKYTVMVTNVPITISIPSTITVPLGGCSVPYSITLSNPPYSDISISFQYDTRLYSLHIFWVNQQTSYNQLSFDKTITKRWLSFCAEPSLGVTTVSVQVFLGGTNYKSYQLSTSRITVNAIANTTTNIAPSFNLVTKNLQKTYAGFQIIPNINGHIYYQIMKTSSTTFMDLINLKASVKEYDLLLQSQADYLQKIYETDRYHRIGMRNVAVGSNPLQFSDLLPGLSYTLCVYFENQHRVVTNQRCTTFSTISWGTIKKAIITFNQTIYESQLNKMLCFFVRASSSKIYQVVDLEGRSCSLTSSAQNYNYKYNGTTQSSQLSQTLLYFVTNTNLTTDPSVALFSNIYDSNGITSASLSLALSSYAINYIKSSYLIGSFNPPDIVDKSSTYTPAFTYDQPVFDNTTNSISINNINLDKPGTIYFILTFSRKITYNKITGHTDIDIRSPITPTTNQILNCQDGYGDNPLQCTRVVFIGNAKKITFSNLSPNSMYVIYYSIANQYPLRPVLVSDVSNFTVLTTFQLYLGVYRIVLLLIIGFMLSQ